MSNVDINVDGRTENRTPISHPATSRCDKNGIAQSMVSRWWFGVLYRFQHYLFIVLGFNDKDTSNLVGHFVSSPRDREKRDRRDSSLISVWTVCIKYRNFYNKNSAEGVIAPAGAKVTGATIRMWLLNKFISFLAVLTWKTGLKKM